MEFARIDVDHLKAELKVQERAIQQARRNLPAKTDTNLDSAQRDIVQHCSLMLEHARQISTEELDSDHQRRQEIELEIDASRIETIPGRSAQQIHSAQYDSRAPLIHDRKTERLMRRELSAFVTSNEIHRESDYPDSHILHWAIVVALVVAESIANSYFFSKGSDLGLLGGVFQAFLISVVNIGASLLAGLYVLPSFNHVKELPRPPTVVRRIVSSYSEPAGVYLKSFVQRLKSIADPGLWDQITHSLALCNDFLEKHLDFRIRRPEWLSRKASSE